MQFTRGYNLADKLLILLYSIYLIITFPINKIFSFINCPFNRDMFSPSYLIKTKDGLYSCKGRESYMMSELFESNLRPHCKTFTEGVFVDVGAYIGKYTIMISNQIQNKGKVISIEPILENYKRLESNVKFNNLKNVTILNLACSDKIGKEKIYSHKDDPGLFSIVTPSTKYTEVKSKTLDKIISDLKIKNVDLVKIDVEDAESKVFKGMKNILTRGKTKIIFEARTDTSVKACRKILEKYGYTMKQLDNRHWVATRDE